MNFTLNKLTIIISIALTSVFAAPSSVQCMETVAQQPASQPLVKNAFQQLCDRYGNGKLPDLSPEQVEEYCKDWSLSSDRERLIKSNPSLKIKAAQLVFYEKNILRPAFAKAGFNTPNGYVGIDETVPTFFWNHDYYSGISRMPCRNMFLMTLDGGAIDASRGPNLPEELTILWATKLRLSDEIEKAIEKLKN